MQTAREFRFAEHAVTLLLGAVVAAVIWLAGSAELSWLGFAAAAIYGETPARRRVFALVLRRPPAR